jgi:hypothetical protein
MAAHLGVVAFFGQQLGGAAGRADDRPPLPGTSSMLWMVVPSGILRSGRALPTRASASGPAHDRVAHRQAVGHRM